MKILFFSFFFFIQLNAQDLLNYEYSAKNGLLSSDNYGVTQDKRGYIWVFSESGIMKYDGHNFKSFHKLIFDDVWDIKVDSKDRKWLFYYGKGIQFIQNDKVHSVPCSDEVSQFFYTGEHDDTIFFKGINENKIQRYFWIPGKKLEVYSRKELANYQIVGDYREFGWMLLSRNENQFIYNLSSGKIDSLSVRLSSISGTQIHDIDRVFREVGANYIWYLDGNGLSKRKEDNMIGASYQNTIFENGTGNLILKKKDFEVYSNYRKAIRNKKLEALLNNLFNSPLGLGNIFIDKEENLWVTKSRGEIYFFPKYWKAIDESISRKQNDLDKNVFSRLCINETIIFQTKENLLYSLNIKSDRLFQHSNSFGNASIRRIKSMNNKLYIHASYNFIIATINKEGDAISIEKNIPISPSYDFEFLTPDSILLGNGDLLLVNKGQIIPKYSELPNRTLNLIKSNNWLIYSTSQGIEALNILTNEKKQYPLPNITFIKQINDKIIVGTKTQGGHLFSNNLTKLYGFLPGYEVNDIARLGDNWLVATNKGAVVANINESSFKIKNVLFGQKKIGIQINSICLFSNKVYLFTSNGVKIVEKSFFENSHFKLNFNFERIVVNGSQRSKSNFNFESGTNYLQVVLSSLSFWNLGECYFRYKLHGRDEKWSITQYKNLHFNNLEPGKYVLEVSVSSVPFGVFSPSKSIEFEVLPNLWSLWWFQLLLILGIVMILILTALIVRRFVMIRERRIRDLKSLKLKAITAQLNPHFLFNSLNTIQSLVILKSDYEANKYIGAFAGLMRKVLDSSMEERISLKNEIEFLTNYLDLENQRLNNTLDYSITISKEINPNFIFIYTMVFQPIIENALIHGLLNKKGNKHLRIDFTLTNDFLTCIITDNGIGRKASGERNKNQTNKSWASTILNEKMQLLNHRNKEELKIDIEDLFEQDTCLGTKVSIRMKVSKSVQ